MAFTLVAAKRAPFTQSVGSRPSASLDTPEDSESCLLRWSASLLRSQLVDTLTLVSPRPRFYFRARRGFPRKHLIKPGTGCQNLLNNVPAKRWATSVSIPLAPQHSPPSGAAHFSQSFPRRLGQNTPSLGRSIPQPWPSSWG